MSKGEIVFYYDELNKLGLEILNTWTSLGVIDRSSVKCALRSIAAGENSTTYTRRVLPYVKKYAETFGG